MRKKFNIDKFNHGETKNKFQEEFKKSLDQERINDLTLLWTLYSNQGSYARQNQSILGLNQKIHSKDWITVETWNEIKTRETTKQKINGKR
jgi:hypothetical protein